MNVQGSSFYTTKDTKLACYLLTCGFKGHNDNPPLRKDVDPQKDPDKVVCSWNFDSSGKSNFGHSFDKCFGAWKKGASYIAANPECPLSHIIGTLKNYQFCLDAINADSPWNTVYSYKFDGKTFLVLKDSKKHKKIKEKLGY